MSRMKTENFYTISYDEWKPTAVVAECTVMIILRFFYEQFTKEVLKREKISSVNTGFPLISS